MSIWEIIVFFAGAITAAPLAVHSWVYAIRFRRAHDAAENVLVALICTAVAAYCVSRLLGVGV